MNFGIDRRNFVLASSAAFAVDGPVRAGIIGAGGRGRFLKTGLAAASTGAVAYGDYEKLLEDKSIPVVIVATPDLWHAQMVIDAMHAGKDVYVEKPLAHTIEDGYRIIAAVRETKRIVQVGMQRRSSALLQETHRQMKGGCGRRTVDQLVGQAAHRIDVFHWFMGSQHPLTVGYKAMRYAPGNDQMAQDEGSKARFDFGREGYRKYREDPKAVELKPTVEKKLPGSFGPATRAHIRQFLDCIKTRRQPNAPVESLRKGVRVRFIPNTRGMEA